MRSARSSIFPALALASVALWAAPARAAITSFDAFANQQYMQTANNTAPSGTPQDFFASRLFYNSAGDITSATGVTGAMNSPLTYTPQAGGFAIAQTGFLTPAQLASMITPGSNLVFNVTGGTLSGAGGLGPPYQSSLYSAVPYLTGNSYNTLQGLNASQGVALTINGFTAVQGANESDVFVTIVDAATNAVVYSTSFFNAPGTTGFNVAANTLAAGTKYNLEIDYSSRLNTTGSVFNVGDVPFTVGYDTRTQASFFTATAAAVPEPASLALTALGMASALLVARRRG